MQCSCSDLKVRVREHFSCSSFPFCRNVWLGTQCFECLGARWRMSGTQYKEGTANLWFVSGNLLQQTLTEVVTTEQHSFQQLHLV